MGGRGAWPGDKEVGGSGEGGSLGGLLAAAGPEASRETPRICWEREQQTRAEIITFAHMHTHAEKLQT